MSDNIRHVSFNHNFHEDLIEERKLYLKYAPTTLMWAGFLKKQLPQDWFDNTKLFSKGH